MKAYWQYSCGFGHFWTLFKEIDAEELPQDSLCPYGHEYVVLRKQLAADIVQIAVRSAAEIEDDEVHGKGYYYLVLGNVHTGEEQTSRGTYFWEDVKRLMDRFRNLSPQQAWTLLDKFEMDSASDDKRSEE